MNPSRNRPTRPTTPPEATEDQVVSRHVTSEGVLVYLRTASGALHAKLIRWGDHGSQIVAAGDRDRVGPNAVRPRLRAC